MKNKKQKKSTVPKKESPLNPNTVLDKQRIITLFGEIDEELSKKAIKELIKLDSIDSSPITLIINSPGGDCTEGLAIIDTMKMMRNVIYTVITGMSASMAGIISVCGDVRLITPNAFWMAHPLAGGSYDYKQHVIDYVDFIKRLDTKLQDILLNHTKLTKRDVQKFTHGELWLDAEQCIEKGVCDEIANEKEYKERLPLISLGNKKSNKKKKGKK